MRRVHPISSLLHAYIVPSLRYCVVRGPLQGPDARTNRGVAGDPGWPNVLIAAPTGSGKTLAAFLAAIDDLVRQGLEEAFRTRRKSFMFRLSRLSPTTFIGISRRRSPPFGNFARRPPRCRNPHLGANRRHPVRARAHAPPPATYPRHDAGVSLCAARVRVGPQMLATTRTVIVDEIHAVGSKQARRPSRSFA